MKILYLNHVCWEWIFQRPQILALKLEEDFDCTIVNKMFILGKTVAHDNREPKRRKNVWLFPKEQKYKAINHINNLLYRIYIKRIANKYDLIWACHPSVYDGVPKKFKGKIVYDCMDNHIALTSEDNKERLKGLERRLIEESDLIFVTSNKLKETVSGLQDAILVRNGFSTDMPSMPIKNSAMKDKYIIGYFGTVSSWFNFDLLKNSIKECGNVEYHIIGPVSTDQCDVSKLESKDIVFEGIVEHKRLPEATKDYDALIMPFVVNDIILSVDPVKLYEYINLGKCVISVWYPEVDRFEPFVYFYRTKYEYIELIKHLSVIGFKPKYTEEQRKDFIEQNSWDARYSLIREKILELTNEKS